MLSVEGLAARDQVLRLQLQRCAVSVGFVGSGSSTHHTDEATADVRLDPWSSPSFGADTGVWRTSNPPDCLLTFAYARSRSTIWAGS